MKRWRYEARLEGVERPPGATAGVVEPPPSGSSPPEITIQTLVSRQPPYDYAKSPDMMRNMQGKKHTYVWQCVSTRPFPLRCIKQLLTHVVVLLWLPFHTVQIWCVSVVRIWSMWQLQHHKGTDQVK